MICLSPVEATGTARDSWTAEAGKRRMRPILPTAAAVSLALTPITRAVFQKPMADAVTGGIIVGMVLTLQFLLALYVTWFRVEASDRARAA
jgi:multidrug efflux pump subunit AcrB